MPRNFDVVTDGIYRGGAPSEEELQLLKNVYGIRRIISLDEQSGKKAAAWAKQNKVQHISVPINPNLARFDDKLKYLVRNIRQLLDDAKPVYIHCLQGQDRTGLAIALYRIQKQGWGYEQALNEAKKYGFGNGVSKNVRDFWTKILYTLANDGKFEDVSSVYDTDVVAEAQESLNKNGPLAVYPAFEGTMVEGIPIGEPTVNRKNFYANLMDSLKQSDVFPGVGVYDGGKALRGAGPVENSGYFALNMIASNTASENMMYRLAYAIQTSLHITDQEKKQAEKALEIFDKVDFMLREASEHLNTLKEPFEKTPNLPQEVIDQKKGLFNRFRTQVKKNYDDIQKKAFFAAQSVEMFKSDTEISEMINSFDTSMRGLTMKVEDLMSKLNDFESDKYQAEIVEGITDIQNKTDELHTLIDETIKNHFKNHILGSSWVGDTAEKLKQKIEHQEPLLQRLFKERQEVLEGGHDQAESAQNILQTQQRPIPMNPERTQQFWNPQDQRPANLVNN